MSKAPPPGFQWAPATIGNLRTARDNMADATTRTLADSFINDRIVEVATAADVRRAVPLRDLRGSIGRSVGIGEVLSLEILAYVGRVLEDGDWPRREAL